MIVMLLKDSLFTIVEMKQEPGHAEVEIQLDINHPIYTGHFPDNPITPGVCLLQIAIELFSMQVGKAMTMKASKSIKFVNIVRPNQCSRVSYLLDWEQTESDLYNVKVVVRNAENLFCKFSLRLSPLQN